MPPITVRYDQLPADMYSEIFKVKVGEEGKVYTLFTGVATHISGYFENALKEIPEDGVEICIQMPEDTVEIFDTFSEWMYGGIEALRNSESYDFNHVLDVYKFAESRQIPLLQNNIIDSLWEKEPNDMWVDESHILWAYQETAEDSPLRRFLIRAMLRREFIDEVDSLRWKEEIKSKDQSRLPSEALWDIATEMASLSEESRVTLCRYHIHPEDEDCDPLIFCPKDSNDLKSW